MTPREHALKAQPVDRELVELCGRTVGMVRRADGDFVCVAPKVPNPAAAVFGQVFTHGGRTWRVSRVLEPAPSRQPDPRPPAFLTFRAEPVE